MGNIYAKSSGFSAFFSRRNVHQLVKVGGLLLSLLVISYTAFAQTTITGAVYRDFNANGTREYSTATPNEGEIGVGGVTVSVYSGTAVVATAITSSTGVNAGSYNFSISTAGPFRVQFTNLPDGFFEGPQGANSGTSVQFVANAATATASLGINHPDDYCQASPYFVVPCYVNGNSTGSGTASTRDVLVALPYSSTGTSPAIFDVAFNNQVGTVYGLAYQRQTGNLFSSALVKRHSGLGPSGAGAIYLSRFTSTTGIVTTSTFTTIAAGTVLSNTARGLSANAADVNRDPSTFDQVGKAGLGDIEISSDGTRLFVVNLSDRRLYQININNPTTPTPTAGTTTSFAIPNPTNGCPTNSVFRPFGLKYYRDRVYVGGVCTNENVTTTKVYSNTAGTSSLTLPSNNGMQAVVFEFNPSGSTFTQVLSFPLTYRKGASNADKSGVDRADFWLPWVSSQPTTFVRSDGSYSYPQPILAGIEFDVNGDMIVSIRDRFGDQYGNRNLGPIADDNTLYRPIAPGDILRAGKCNPAVNQWTIESNASVCARPATAGANNGQGPGGGEYYWGDRVAVGANHLEQSEGGLALLPGRDEIATIALDPTDVFDTGGIKRLTNSTGAGTLADGVQIYSAENVATFGKANGLGDLELNCSVAPIEIGNRLFSDGDFLTANGIQDNGNAGSNVSGAVVQLYRIVSGVATLVASTTTNASGEYYFRSTTVTGLVPNAEYQIRVALNQFATPTTITVPNAGSDDLADSDAFLQTIGGVPTAVVSLTTGDYGENNHSYDIGFIRQPASIGDFVFEDLNRNGIQDAGEPGIQGVTVQLLDGSGNAVAGVAPTTTNASGFYSFTGLTPTTPYIVAFTAPNGYTATLVDQGGNDAIDSDVNPATGRTGSYTIASGASLTTVDAGFYRSATIGDRVFVDANRNGLQDAGETGLAGVTVQLLTGTNTVVASTTTNASGIYSFTGLTPGVSYSVVFSLPTNYSASPAKQGGNDALDSDANAVTGRTGAYTLTSGQSLTSVDAGFFLLTYDLALRKTVQTLPSPLLPLSNVTFRIEVFNQGELPASGIVVTDYVPTGFVFAQAANPGWTAGPNPTFPLAGTITPGSSTTISIVLQVAATSGGQSLTNAAEISTDNGDDIDSAPDNIANNDGPVTDDAINNQNGDQDDHDIAIVSPLGFASLGNLVFEDLNANGVQDAGDIGIAGVTVQLLMGANTVVSSTTTNASGIYSFTGLTPGVSYSVVFSRPAGYSSTVANAGGNDAVDSDADPVTGRTGSYVLTSNENNTTVDAGFYRPATIGDRVFADNNNNGIQDAGEPGIPGVTVQLLTGTNTVVSSTTTSASGIYSFTGLTPGTSYSVVFSRPTGYTSVAAGQGGNDALDSDADPTTGRTGSYTLASNGSNLNVDAGFSCIPPVVTATGGTVSCTTPSIQLQATSSITPSTYAWTGPGGFTSTLQNPTVSVAGTYTVVVTSNAGCSSTAVATAIVTQNITPPTGVVASNTGPLTCTLTTATISATSTTGGVTYRWTGPNNFTSASQTFTTSVPGVYVVVITAPNGCTNTASTTLQQNLLAPTVSLANTGPLTCTLTTATISATASEAVSYRFAGPGGFVGTSASFVTSVAGLYSVTATSANGCTAVATTTVQQDATVPTVTASNTGPLNCTSASATVSAAGSPGVTYRWVGPAGFTSTAASFGATVAGTYSVTVTSANGCTAVATTTVGQDATAPAGVAASNTGPLTCTLTTATVSVTTTTTGVTYRWVGPGGFTSTAASFGATVAGTYSVTVTSANGCTATASTTVSQDITAPAGVAASNTGPLTCTLTTATVSVTTTTTGVTYRWVGPGGFTSTAASFGATVAGTYSVTVTSVNGCTAVATTTVGQDATAPAGVAASNTGPLTCTLTTATVSVTTTTTGVTYRWVGPGGFTSTAASFGATVAGTYSVTVTSANGCSAVATTTVGQDITAPAVTASNTGPLTCTLTSVTVSAAGSPGVTYRWVGPAGFTSTAASFAATVPGLYSVTVTSANGCTATASTTVQQDLTVPTVTATNSGPLTCTLTSVTISATANEPVTYRWNIGVNTPSFTTSVAGLYSVTVTSVNGCSAVATTTVQQDATVPTVTASNTGPLNCTLTSVTVSAVGSPGVSYRWNTGAITPTISANAAGVYSVTVTSPNGCTATASTTVGQDITAPAGVVASNTGPLTCSVATATVSVATTTPGVTYQWVGPGGFTSIASSFTTNVAGLYSVTVTSANGCATTASTNLIQNTTPLADVSISNTGPLTCTLTTVTVSATSTTPGVTYSWTGPGGFTSSAQSFTTSVPGTYVVTIAGPNGCVPTVISTIVNQDVAVPAGVTASNTGPLSCTLSNVTVSATSTTPGVTYRWIGPGGFTSTAQSFATAAAGLYSVTVTSANGCTAVATTTVGQDNTGIQNITISNTGPLNCTLTTVTVTASSSTPGVVYSWSGPNGFTSAIPSFTTSVPGLYSLTLTAPNGCSAVTSTTVIQDIAAPAGVVASNTGPLTCTLTTATVSVTTTTPGVTYNWVGPGGFTSTTASFTTTVAGLYTVTITGANGCTATASTTVGQDIAASAGVVASNTGPLTCTLTTVTVSATSTTPGVVYSWSGPNGFASTAASFATSVPGTYSVIVTNPANGCTTTATTTVGQDATTPAGVVASNTGPLTCILTTTTVSVTTTTPGVTYRWTGPNGFVSTTASFGATLAGLYSVTVTSPNGCTATASTTVLQDLTVPTVTATNTGPLTCALTTATVSASTSTAGVTYSWVGPNGFTSTAASFATTVPGLYSVTVTSPNGCTATTSTTIQQDLTAP
ncbi:SdrD B-like domain-containing protein, partial [Spirosoma fluminis]